MSRRFGLAIKAAAEADAPGLAELLGGADPTMVTIRLEQFRQAPGSVLIASEWGPPSGVICVHWYPVLTADQPAAMISLLLVAPEARRRGIGRLLVKAACQAARMAGCTDIEMSVAAEQPDLSAFLLNSGFIISAALLSRNLRKKAV